MLPVMESRVITGNVVRRPMWPRASIAAEARGAVSDSTTLTRASMMLLYSSSDIYKKARHVSAKLNIFYQLQYWYDSLDGYLFWPSIILHPLTHVEFNILITELQGNWWITRKIFNRKSILMHQANISQVWQIDPHEPDPVLAW